MFISSCTEIRTHSILLCTNFSQYLFFPSIWGESNFIFWAPFLYLRTVFLPVSFLYYVYHLSLWLFIFKIVVRFITPRSPSFNHSRKTHDFLMPLYHISKLSLQSPTLPLPLSLTLSVFESHHLVFPCSSKKFLSLNPAPVLSEYWHSVLSLIIGIHQPVWK